MLDYVRHGQVTHPATEKKETVMAELAYFGIEAREENINDTSARQIMCRSAIADMIDVFQKEADGDELNWLVHLAIHAIT